MTLKSQIKLQKKFKKMVNDLGLHYETKDACQNDCNIYCIEYSYAIQCQVCDLSRWSLDKGKGRKEKKIVNKVLRYLPITPRSQRILCLQKQLKL